MSFAPAPQPAAKKAQDGPTPCGGVRGGGWGFAHVPILSPARSVSEGRPRLRFGLVKKLTSVPRYEYPEDPGRAESLVLSHRRAAAGFAAAPPFPPSAPDNSERSRCTFWPSPRDSR